MENSIDKIRRKLAKLKNLYEGAKSINNEEEAAAAALAIQRLLTQYNLSMDEIGTMDDKGKEVIEEEVSGFDYRLGGPWEQYITYVICKWNFCHCYSIGHSYRRLIIVGEPENIENVKWLVGVLKKRFVDFSKIRFKEYFKKMTETGDKPRSKDAFQRSYLSGCASGLEAKLKAEHEREKKEESELANRISALVVRKDAAIVEYVNTHWKNGVKPGRSYKQRFDEARVMGYEDGKNTSINKPIASGKTAVNSVRMLN